MVQVTLNRNEPFVVLQAFFVSPKTSTKGSDRPAGIIPCPLLPLGEVINRRTRQTSARFFPFLIKKQTRNIKNGN
jgi:hypothetical protein